MDSSLPFALVIGGSLIGEWLGIAQVLGDWWFWARQPGLGVPGARPSLAIPAGGGPLRRFALLWTLVRPHALANPAVGPIVRMFLVAAVAIPLFLHSSAVHRCQGQLHGGRHLALWIIHLWVEGFFEFFATTVVALTFFQLGLAGRNVALRVIYPRRDPLFPRWPDGTGHHWYFTGQSNFNMALSACSRSSSGSADLADAGRMGLRAHDGGGRDATGKAIEIPHKWAFYFLMAVGFWNFVGAGMLGFLINLPIVSYYEVGTLLTPPTGTRP
jgi:nitric oxide reductase subunit B